MEALFRGPRSGIDGPRALLLAGLLSSVVVAACSSPPTRSPGESSVGRASPGAGPASSGLTVHRPSDLTEFEATAAFGPPERHPGCPGEEACRRSFELVVTNVGLLQADAICVFRVFDDTGRVIGGGTTVAFAIAPGESYRWFGEMFLDGALDHYEARCSPYDLGEDRPGG